jgi:guanylate kinase
MAKILGIMIPIIALCIPIVAILTAHQRKMAELIHSRQGENVDALRGRLAQMEMEMQEMRDRVNTAAIANDRPQRPAPIEEHLNA